MNKKVIYTAIFGGKDGLQEPLFVPSGFDFICFTDNKNLTSDIWDIRVVEPPFKDPVRCARYYKVLAHQNLNMYEVSVWVDGNMILIGDVNDLIERYLVENSFATYNHAEQKRRFLKFFWIKDKKFARNCIYDEAEDLINKTERGVYMDDPEIMKLQMKRYREEGYPTNNGLAVTMVLLRKHNDQEVKKIMESWWEEIKSGSRRDQLSFNYVAWKHGFEFSYIEGDPRYNKFFSKVRHAKRENFKAK